MANIFTRHSGQSHDAKAYGMAGRCVVVDKDGRGDFTSVQAAADFWKARGVGGRIWVRAGTYNEKVTISTANTFLEGESWAVIVDGTGQTNALSVTANYITVKNLHFKTPQGGRDDDAVTISAAANACTFDTLQVRGSDGHGIATYGGTALIHNCYITQCDGNGIYIDGPDNRVNVCNMHGGGTLRGIFVSDKGDNSVITGNYITGASTTSQFIYVHSDAENCLIVGNRTNGGNIDDDSGTSTVTANEEG